MLKMTIASPGLHWQQNLRIDLQLNPCSLTPLDICCFLVDCVEEPLCALRSPSLFDGLDKEAVNFLLFSMSYGQQMTFDAAVLVVNHQASIDYSNSMWIKFITVRLFPLADLCEGDLDLDDEMLLDQRTIGNLVHCDLSSFIVDVGGGNDRQDDGLVLGPSLPTGGGVVFPRRLLASFTTVEHLEEGRKIRKQSLPGSNQCTSWSPCLHSSPHTASGCLQLLPLAPPVPPWLPG